MSHLARPSKHSPPRRSSADPGANTPVLTQVLTIPAARDAFNQARRADLTSEELQAHRVVGQAVGILMERFEITEDRALHCLQRVAATGNVALQQVARVVVDRTNLRARSDALGGDEP
jgi:AmiR/NasT family two-component response regulator